MIIRPLEAGDRDRVVEILLATGRFTEEEIGWATDLVDESLAHPERGEYRVQVAEIEGAGGAAVVCGYVCYGPTPLAEGVWDLYWIAVDPSAQGQGVGRVLLQFVESEVRRTEGRMLLIETSSKESYAPTRRFYERNGYQEISRIKDFYRVQDDKIVLSRSLQR